MKGLYRLRADDREPWRWRGEAHGRVLRLRSPSPGKERERLDLWLIPEGCGDEMVALFKFFRGDEAALARMPALEDADWGERCEELGGTRVGAGFALDWDVDVASPFLRLHGGALAGYLERFSPAARALVAELPWMILSISPDKTTPQTLRRDVECAHELLRLFEERRFAGSTDLWQHSGAPLA